MSNSVFANMRSQLVRSKNHTSPEFVYGAQLPWEQELGQLETWDQVCAWSLEHFGLPGDVYTTHLGSDHMTWWFRTQQDRLVFLLRNGTAQCIS